jgi:hypothetical protein
MTATAFPAARRRVSPVVAHVYTLPVVRELPSQPVASRDSLAW